MVEVKNKDVICVIGMHRSGTSMVTRLLHRKSRSPQPGLKMIEVFNLAREHPAFFLEMAVWAFNQVRKKIQVQGS